MTKVTEEELNNYLVSIGGLINWHNQKIITDAGYFSTDKGWFGLIKTVIEELIALGWNKEVTQIKEKFGGLRFYAYDVPEGGYDIINKYQNMSFHICEVCGNEGALHNNNGWYKTVCEEHKNNN